MLSKNEKEKSIKYRQNTVNNKISLFVLTVLSFEIFT